MGRQEKCLAKDICFVCEDDCGLYLEDEPQDERIVNLTNYANEVARKYYIKFKEKLIGGSKMTDNVFLDSDVSSVFDIENLGVTKADNNSSEPKIDLGVEKPLKGKKKVKEKEESAVEKNIESNKEEVKVSKQENMSGNSSSEVEVIKNISARPKETDSVDTESESDLVGFVFNFLGGVQELMSLTVNCKQNIFTDREFALLVLDIFENFIRAVRLRIEEKK